MCDTVVFHVDHINYTNSSKRKTEERRKSYLGRLKIECFPCCNIFMSYTPLAGHWDTVRIPLRRRHRYVSLGLTLFTLDKFEIYLTIAEN